MYLIKFKDEVVSGVYRIYSVMFQHISNRIIVYRAANYYRHHNNSVHISSTYDTTYVLSNKTIGKQQYINVSSGGYSYGDCMLYNKKQGELTIISVNWKFYFIVI